MIYSADFLVTMDGDVIKDGALRVRDNVIVQVGTSQDLSPAKGERYRHFEETVLMPGLINSHCHLELGHARNLFPERESFSMWVSRLQKSLEDLQSEDYLENIRLGAWECIRTGTTTVVDTGNTGYNFWALPGEPIRSYPLLEAVGLDPQAGVARFLKEWDRLVPGEPATALAPRSYPSVAAHSAYGCSEDLLKQTVAVAGRQGFPLSIHLAESAEEQELFEHKQGRLYEFCQRKFPGVTYPKDKNPISYLARMDLLPQKSLAIHCNTLDDKTASLLAEKKATVVHCPRSREFFGHPEFPYELCYNFGIPVVLGTDSLASNENYNLFEEMAEFHRVYPQVECEWILAMATSEAARAIDKAGSLGKIKEGYLADVIGIHMAHHPKWSIYDEIVCEEHDVNFALINGEEVVV